MSTRSPQLRHGFTLIELLTVIAIIGILAAILIPTVGRVRDKARQAKCTGNVRQITALLISFANQDRLQRFPNIADDNKVATGAYPWDVKIKGGTSRQLTLEDLAKGAGRSVMFCPAGKPPENDEYFSSFAYATIDYILLVGESGYGPAGVVNSPANVYYSDRIKAEYQTIDLKATGLITVPPSRRELVVDALGVTSGSWNWTSPILGKPSSNHRSGNTASGSNIGFVDGHVAWRSVEQMREMTGSNTPKGRTTGLPVTFVW